MSIETVVANMKKSMDLAKNAKPFLRFILGKANEKPSSENWFKLRPSVIDNFFRNKSPLGDKWADLKPVTVAYKAEHYPGKPMLRRTDRLIKSLWDYNEDTVTIMTNRTLIYGTKVPYAGFLQSGTDKMEARPYMGLGKKQRKEIKNLLTQYLKGPFTGKQIRGVE